MQLKLNNVYMADCLEAIGAVPDHSIKTIIADPPYFMGMTHNGHKGAFVDLQICKPFYRQLAQEMARVLKDTGEFYIFSDWRGYAFYYPIFADYLPVKNMIVWDKMSGPGSYYSSAHELIIYGCMSGEIKKHDTNVWRMKSFTSGARQEDGEKIHPAQKPVALIQRMIEDSTQPGDTVLDPFMGSGTTAIAAMRSGRNWIGFEVDEAHFIEAQERIAGELRKAAGGAGNE